MSDRQGLVHEITKQFLGNVKGPAEILFSLVEKGHYQAATDILPQVREPIQAFEEALKNAFNHAVAQDDYYNLQRKEAELLAAAPQDHPAADATQPKQA